MSILGFLPSRPTAELLALIGVLIVVGLVDRWLRERAEPPAGGTVAGHARLIDGDSFHLDGTEVRLEGIDAPEGRQTCTRNGKAWACGEAAKRELARLIGGRDILCTVRHRDQFGRLLARCTVGGVELNRAMVASGFAVAFGPRLTRVETEAREQRRGLWAGEFERPQDWRRANETARQH